MISIVENPKLKPRKRRTPKRVGTRALVVNRLENVSKDVFKQYYALITELVGDSPGIYALYDGGDLYYVGKSTELRKRVRHHLKDRHLASWTHFSLYLARREEHIHEIESLLVRISNPKGNRVIPRGRSTGAMVKKLKSLIKERQRQELANLFTSKQAAGSVRRHSTKNMGAHSLAGLVSRPTKLFRTYKGREYTATLSPKGQVTIKGRRFNSATAAAKAVIQRKGAVSGRAFWYIRSGSGDWVRLMEYRG
jgi:hypothetical protein